MLFSLTYFIRRFTDANFHPEFIAAAVNEKTTIKLLTVLRMAVEIYNKYHIPAKRSANVRARAPFCSLNTWLVFREDGLFLNILSIENDDAKSIP